MSASRPIATDGLNAHRSWLQRERRSHDDDHVWIPGRDEPVDRRLPWLAFAFGHRAFGEAVEHERRVEKARADPEINRSCARGLALNEGADDARILRAENG